jgi:hypothetical protein
MTEILSLRPFVPAKDFGRSLAFYQALGFTLEHGTANIAILKLGRAGFILQNFYVEALADNFVLELLVSDAEAWWASVDMPALAERFGTRMPVAPVVQPWGLKVGFMFDPSGVLWHVSEPPG